MDSLAKQLKRLRYRSWRPNISSYCPIKFSLLSYKVLLIVLKAQMGVAPKYLRDAIRLLTSASTLRFLRCLDRRELFVPRTRTTSLWLNLHVDPFRLLALPYGFWNRLPPSARASFISSNLSTSLSLLKTYLFS